MSTTTPTLFDFSATRIDHREESLSAYRDKVVLVVNVASRCGFTGQYASLESLYKKYRDRGFVVLGFPCNQFMGQEPGSEEEIAAFCRTTYDVSFPLFAKIEVNGSRTHPLFQFLKQSQPGLFGSEAIKWNFTKFLVGRDGVPVHRYAPTIAPERLASDIEAIL